MADSGLSAAQKAKIRRLTAPRELSAIDEGAELNVVPFLDIIVNVLIFVLATVAVTFTAAVTVAPPRRALRRLAGAGQLTVMIAAPLPTAPSCSTT